MGVVVAEPVSRPTIPELVVKFATASSSQSGTGLPYFKYVFLTDKAPTKL